MKASTYISFAASLANFSSASLTNHRQMSAVKPKRALLTCFETYGGGSINCGGADSLFCYDPTLGETCCEMDNGYCRAGDFCAPVAGFCCTVGEDPETCAARLDFTLPPSFSIAPPTTLPTSPSSTGEAVLVSPTSTPSATVSTSTVQILLASAISTVSVVQVAALTLDTDGMTPQFTAPAGNKMTPDYTGPVNTTRPVPATRTGDTNVAVFTGAAGANRISEMGSTLGLIVAALGMTL